MKGFLFGRAITAFSVLGLVIAMPSRVFGGHELDLCDNSLIGERNTYGHQIAEYNGIPAYSNGSCTNLNPGEGRYQCVELIERYFNRFDWVGNGSAYFRSAPEKGLAPLKNKESTIPPKEADIVGFGGSEFGHVALVTKVEQIDGANYLVHIIEQNASPTGEAVLSMTRDGQGRYIVAPRGSLNIEGWLRYFPPPAIPPGMYPGPVWNAPSSYAFLEAYERNGEKEMLGSADTRTGETPYVHPWCIQTLCITLQDFFGGTYGDTALILNTQLNKAYLVRTAFWAFYQTNSGPTDLGAPIEEEHAPVPNQTHIHPCPETARSCQGFQNGTLLWDGAQVSGMSYPFPPQNLRIN